ncbi:AlbA family DNA-binding domain-containing protein [Brumimicrobium mesophilum]|uniref:AlbA family DNA-binding domain-containing protein n=1 Tax=Brumimicrobium mesophilum TaxID=392717 RepID=UPI000D1421E5|nr:RNA-binding domain-containing protein [Brumimicrobium mesophilum]
MNILKSYIREGEHQTQDFKFRVDDAKKIARTLAAFANTDGGRLLIGVKDNGKVVGVNPEEEFHVIQGAASLYCKPELTVKTQIMQDDHKLVLEITVDEVANKPVKALDDDGVWKTYVRRADHTLLASKILIGVWKKQRTKTSTPQTFDKDEQLILNTIKDAGEITLSKLYRITKLKKSFIDKLLILFITWNVVKINISPGGTYFSIREE